MHNIWIELNWNWKKMNWIGIELKDSESDLNLNWIELKNPESNLNWNWIELKKNELIRALAIRDLAMTSLRVIESSWHRQRT